MLDDPLMEAVKITRRDNPLMSRYIKKLLEEPGDIIANDKEKRIQRIQLSKKSKIITYRTINPTLESHSIYSTTYPEKDSIRVPFTRLRTSSHRLKVEIGRWSRIPHELRMCQCELEVQTEKHALTNCPL